MKKNSSTISHSINSLAFNLNHYLKDLKKANERLSRNSRKMHRPS